ncbi:MAG TPA: response regulator [Blastocatellia bacterium]|nr:response regulator [Blastocatellia bacterium]
MFKTVMVVEDDFDTLNPLAELLRIKGYAVITASNAEEALNVARKRRPDLVITDIVLPGRSGLHFISSIRKDDVIKSTPIIVISGCGPMILVEAESAGANICLEKPIHIELFWSAIEQVLGDGRIVDTVQASRAAGAPNGTAGEIDTLVEKLRHCASKGEREDILKQLKEQILKLHARPSARF